MIGFRKILKPVLKKTGLSTDLFTYWHTDSCETIGRLFPYMQGFNNFSWVIGVSRIFEFDWSRLSWTYLTKTKQKPLINLLVLRMCSHMIITRYKFNIPQPFLEYWCLRSPESDLLRKLLATCKNTVKLDINFQYSSSQPDRKSER